MHRLVKTPFTIVVPARNEESTIAYVLREVNRLTDDLIVVDGHSRDRTALIALNFGARVVRDNNCGKGDAVRVGLSEARHPIVVFIDADGSHDPLDIPRLIAPIAAGESDLVMGSRMRGGSDELFATFSEAIRLAGSAIITLAINYRFGVRLTDYQNGFRAIRKEVGLAIGLTSNISTIEQEMAMRCLRLGYRVSEIAAHEYRRRDGVSKISPLTMGHRYVWSLMTGICVGRKKNPRRIRAISSELDAQPAAPEALTAD